MGHRDFAMPVVKEWMEKNNILGTVLELGPGRDRQFRNFFEKRSMRYMGCDPVLENKEVYRNDKMENLSGYLNDYFDLVFSCHSFEHCERPVDALKGAWQVLKSGGWWFSITPVHSDHHILEADEDHIMVLTPAQLTRLLHYCGFVDVMVWGDRHPSAPEDWDVNIFAVGRKP